MREAERYLPSFKKQIGETLCTPIKSLTLFRQAGRTAVFRHKSQTVSGGGAAGPKTKVTQ
ncbi:MAG: hypothetical protein DYH05_02760 [Acidobacteria bacterium ACB1]|nr:hypothetical protein [Acidobacteria bacterium ACB1]RIJ94551.1 MAG: hypothetical protein DCC44_04290 [Acidobacteriota bacterium]